MKEFLNNINFLFKDIYKHKIKLSFYILCNLIIIITGIIMPIISANIIIHLTNNELSQLLFMAIILSLINISAIIIDYISRCISNFITNNINKNLNEYLLDEYISSESKNIDLNGTGEIINRIINDTNNIITLLPIITKDFTSFIKGIGTFIVIFIINPLFFLFFIFQMLVITYIGKIRTRNIYKLDKENKKITDLKNNFFIEIIRSNRDIKMLNSYDSLKNEIQLRNDLFLNSNINLQKQRDKFSVVAIFISIVFRLLLIILFITTITNNLLTPINALIIYNYSNTISFFGATIAKILDSLQKFNLSSERVKELLDENIYPKETFGTKKLDNIVGNIEFNDVCFSYGDHKVLNNLNLKVNENKTIALVGKSGSGKTTIFNLLCKLYNIDSGNILIDGININELDKDSIRGNITIINQNPYIFNMTIKENLKLVKSDLTDEEMIKVCSDAAIHDYISTLPLKYDTLLGEGGINLSGGQRQRLAIARALLQKTKIILFDEATSALDNETQSKIQKAINNIHNKYTIIIIAHRLSTIIDCDEILFMKDGKIKAKGTHKELLKKSIDYKELYQAEIEK